MGSPRCIVKLGCRDPLVLCNLPERGWMDGVGGCPNVGGVCIGCTTSGFPHTFMPFAQRPPGGKSSTTAVLLDGRTVRALRNFIRSTLQAAVTG